MTYRFPLPPENIPSYDGFYDAKGVSSVPRGYPYSRSAAGAARATYEALSAGERLVFLEYGIMGVLAYQAVKLTGETVEDFMVKWSKRKGKPTFRQIDSKGVREVPNDDLFRMPWDEDWKDSPQLGHGAELNPPPPPPRNRFTPAPGGSYDQDGKIVLTPPKRWPGSKHNKRKMPIPRLPGPAPLPAPHRPPPPFSGDMPIEREFPKKSKGPIDVIDNIIGFVPKTGHPGIDTAVGITKTALKLKKAWDHWYDDTSSEHAAPSKRQRTSTHGNGGATKGPGYNKGRTSVSYMGNYVDSEVTFTGSTAFSQVFWSLSTILEGEEQWNRQSSHVCLCASELRYRLVYTGFGGVVNNGYCEVHIVYDRFGDLGAGVNPPIFKSVDFNGGATTGTKLNMDDRYRFKLITTSRLDVPGDSPCQVPVPGSLFRQEYRRIGRLMSTYGNFAEVRHGKLYLVVSFRNIENYNVIVDHRLRFACE